MKPTVKAAWCFQGQRARGPERRVHGPPGGPERGRRVPWNMNRAAASEKKWQQTHANFLIFRGV